MHAIRWLALLLWSAIDPQEPHQCICDGCEACRWEGVGHCTRPGVLYCDECVEDIE